MTAVLQLLAGVGLFLFAMFLLEESLKNLSGRKFKIFLQRITKNSLGAVAGGAIVTGILQSSSMVSLMVLAFVGAGVFTMRNAMAIILGANLGTTLDSWLVAMMGFKMNIEVAAYPALCLAGFLLILFGHKKTVKELSYFLFGFGLLFIALAFMKDSMNSQVTNINFSKYTDLPLVVFLIAGFLVTGIVQSSSVTMALTLSALHTGAIAFPAAAAIVLGSETGTTIKLLLAAIGGNTSKKRLVFGNVLFNFFLTVFAFIFLKPILNLITEGFGISDPLVALVSFSSFINLFAIFIFLPFLDPFVLFLEKFFRDTANGSTAFIGNAELKEPETALDLFHRETAYFIHNALIFNLEMFEVDTRFLTERSEFKHINDKRRYGQMHAEEKYEFLKQMQGDMQAFYVKFAQTPHSHRFVQLIAAVREAIYAAKCIKDIANNINDLKHSSKDIKFNLFLLHQKQIEMLYRQLYVFLMQNGTADESNLLKVFNAIEKNYRSTLDDFYKNAGTATIEPIDLTTVINFNRELFSSNKAMLKAVKDFVLDEQKAQYFNELPVQKS